MESLSRSQSQAGALGPADSMSFREVHRDVWTLAWPSVLTFVLMTTNGILDRIFVGQLGDVALAGVGVAGQLLFLLISLSMAVTTGTTALVARFTGANDAEQAVRAAGRSMGLCVVIGVVCTVGLLASSEPLLRAMSIAPDARAAAQSFLRIALLGTPAMFVVSVYAAAFRAMGDARSPLRVMLLANAVHLLGDLTLMLGYFGAPRLGLVGGGIAVLASNVLAMLAYVHLARRTPLADAIRWRHLVPTLDWSRRILRIGLPASVTALLRVTSLMSFTKILALTSQGTMAVAALPIGLTAESIAFMPGLGYGVAASALVGQALGAKDPRRAERYGWASTTQAVAVMSVMGLVFFLAARPFAMLFTRNPEVIEIAVSYLRIMAVSEPLLGVGMVLTGALHGAGDTLRPTLLTAATFWGIRIPLAWWLALAMGYQSTGAWLAMALSTCVGGVVTALLFRGGRWKTVRV